VSRYCVFRYRVTKTRYRDFFPDIGHDIGKKNADIGTISGHTRSLPNPILPISGPISGFFPISVPISVQYRDIPVPCQNRYRVFHRYRARYGPDIAKNIGIYGYRNQKKPDVIPDVFAISQYTDIVYFRHRAFSLISGTIGAPPRAACSTGPEATVQALQVVQPVGPQLCRPKGQCLGYCLHACAQRATAEIALVSGGATYSESLAKLET
jgi:hypothetical protein